MTKQPKISVIVPIYKVEKYLKQCVDSIINQTLKDIEIILVDDGSPDNCGKIIDEYAKQDNRVIAVHQENGGYGKAVNHGINIAKGEYIGIVEPDDWIEKYMYETLYNDAKKYHVDVVKGTFYEYFDTIDGKFTRKLWGLADSIHPNINPFNIYDYIIPLQHHASIWTGLYKLSFIKYNKIQMLEINKGRYADQNWRYETLMLANNIYWEKPPFYNYRLTNENASSFKKNNPDDIFDVYTYLNLFLNKHLDKYEIIKPSLYIEIYRHMMWNISRIDKKYYKHCRKRIHEVFCKMDKNIKNFRYFTYREKLNFNLLSSKFYYLDRLIRYFKFIFQNLFSIKISSSRKHKVLKILGMKFSFKRKFYPLECQIRSLQNQITDLQAQINKKCN